MSIGAAFMNGVGGLNAFSLEMSNISDNIANASTVGFKQSNTDFESLITGSERFQYQGSGVRATTWYDNTTTGSIQSSSNPTSFAISGGAGFAPTMSPQVSNNGVPNFTSALQHYTQATDFTVNASGYFVNSAGEYLMGMQETTPYSGNIPNPPSMAALTAVQVNPQVYGSMPAQASSTIDYNANFPASVTPGAASTTIEMQANFPAGLATAGITPPMNVTVYDSLGNPRTLQVAYQKTIAAGPPQTDTYQMYSGPVPDPNNPANTITVPQFVASDGKTPAFGTQPTFTVSTDQLTFDPTTGTLTSATTPPTPLAIDWSTAAAPAAGVPAAPPLSAGSSIQNVAFDFSTLASTESSGSSTSTAITMQSTKDLTGQPLASVSEQIQFYDNVGNPRTLELNYVKTSNDSWTLAQNGEFGSALDPNISGMSEQTAGTPYVNISSNAAINFASNGSLSGNTALSFSVDWSKAQVTDPASGTPAIPPTAPLQAMSINYGTATSGSTQFAGTTLESRSVTDETGQASGSYQSAAIDQDGNVVFSYSNGKQLKPYRVPLVSFADANNLDRLSGSVFAGNDSAAGTPLVNWAGQGNNGQIIPSSVQESNVDIGTQLTQMILTQQAYSSNGKVVSTSNQMMQTVLGLIQG